MGRPGGGNGQLDRYGIAGVSCGWLEVERFGIYRDGPAVSVDGRTVAAVRPRARGIEERS